MPGLAGQLLAFCIAGHHAGLADATAADEEAVRSTLSYRLDGRTYEVPPVTVPPELAALGPPLRFPFRPPARPEEVGFAVAFFARMLFSALVDADRTATEGFCNEAAAAERGRRRPELADLWSALDAYLKDKQANAPATVVNRIRRRVLADCLVKAALRPGFFSLNVPTGGGKTFASLAFALHHAGRHSGLRRVVVAIPFTSIIEQTADEYRKALGPVASLGLVEHHSNLNPARDTRANQLAAENWAAPLVVTTNVQLFESLFAARTSACRKLHRLAGSVIILDEAQTLPVDLLAPTLSALRELVARYNCSVVLCTATQPALEHRNDFTIGLSDVRRIIDEPAALHAALKRVHVQQTGVLSDADLASRLADEPAVLCVVNTRPHAAALYDAVAARRGSPEGCYHLSTFMCPQHRRDVLNEIRQRLKDRKPCRLVSTQLIEAGVDVDFPVVYRAPAGFDSIAQAAGRCNREGGLKAADGSPALGRVFVFDTEVSPPPGMLRQAAQTARELLEAHPDPLDPSAVEAYFRLFYWSRQHQWDKHGVLPNFGYPDGRSLPPFLFRQAAAAYRIIREEQTPVIVPYGERGRKLRDAVLAGGQVDYGFFREAQQYTVSVREPLRIKLAESGAILPHDCGESGLWAWANDSAYSEDKGINAEAVGIDPSLTII